MKSGPMRFTTRQYDDAMEALRCGREQLEPDGRICTVCGDSGHQAFECGHNPLVAMAVCREIASGAEQTHKILHDKPDVFTTDNLHHLIHWLAGYDNYMGQQVGPAIVILPPPEGHYYKKFYWTESCPECNGTGVVNANWPAPCPRGCPAPHTYPHTHALSPGKSGENVYLQVLHGALDPLTAGKPDPDSETAKSSGGGAVSRTPDGNEPTLTLGITCQDSARQSPHFPPHPAPLPSSPPQRRSPEAPGPSPSLNGGGRG